MISTIIILIIITRVVYVSPLKDHPYSTHPENTPVLIFDAVVVVVVVDITCHSSNDPAICEICQSQRR